MPRSGFSLDGPTPDKPLWDRVKAWMAENAPGVSSAVSSAAETVLGNPVVSGAMQVAQKADPLNAMGMGTVITGPARAANFAKWFGKSKVVDEAGEPLRVFKAMHPYKDGQPVTSIKRPSEFPAFDLTESGDAWRGVNIAGFFGDSDTASNFAKLYKPEQPIFPGHLSMQNPFVIDGTGQMAGSTQFGKSGQPFRDAVRSGKYDGVIIKNTKDEGTIYVTLKPEQFKGQFNSGEYGIDNPDFLRAAAPVAVGQAAFPTLADFLSSKEDE